MVLESVLTCPVCGHAKAERMPLDACQWFYECENCATLLRPKPGDCCVFCSYGTQRCPPMQASGAAACCQAVSGGANRHDCSATCASHSTSLGSGPAPALAPA